MNGGSGPRPQRGTEVRAEAWRRSTPEAEAWRRILRAARWGNNRRLRRVVMLLWLGVLALDVWGASSIARRDAVLAIYPTLLLFGFALWAFRRMEIGLARPTLEDRAVMEYGADFEALMEKQRGELFDRQVRESILGRVRRDEREAELRLHAEGVAYRLLRPGLAIAVAGYWAVCMLGPFRAIRGALAATAITFTWFALAVLALPAMVRMWTEPDQVGEPRVLGEEGSEIVP